MPEIVININILSVILILLCKINSKCLNPNYLWWFLSASRERSYIITGITVILSSAPSLMDSSCAVIPFFSEPWPTYWPGLLTPSYWAILFCSPGLTCIHATVNQLREQRFHLSMFCWILLLLILLLLLLKIYI